MKTDPTRQSQRLLNRRDFLKLAATLPAASLLSRLGKPTFGYPQSVELKAQSAGAERPNIIVLIYDAFSALHLSLEGYPRRTTPNIDRFASRATVYHNHHSAGNFTTPSTASFFTGVYPWTHRAFSLGGLVRPADLPNNLFKELEGSYHRLGFTQNIYADQLLYQFEQHLDSHPKLDSFSAAGYTFYNKLFPNDAILGLKSFDEFLFIREQAHGSLFLGLLNDLASLLGAGMARQKLKDLHPVELPRLANTDVYYLVDEVTQGVRQMLQEQPEPTFAYLHLMPPHAPYLPAVPFKGLFADGWAPEPQKKHRLGANLAPERLNSQRQLYDEFIANLDHDFGLLLDDWEQSGILENSTIILTSDHGEMFQKGVSGHSTPLVFEPGVRVPLIISTPGQHQRQDVHALTSTVDLLPSILHIAGKPAPAWCEGQPLPYLGGEERDDRSIFIVEAKKNNAYQPLSKATVALLQGAYKLVHYRGYKNYTGKYELYNLEDDPDELQDIFEGHPEARRLQEELDERLLEADKPYMSG